MKSTKGWRQSWFANFCSSQSKRSQQLPGKSLARSTRSINSDGLDRVANPREIRKTSWSNQCGNGSIRWAGERDAQTRYLPVHAYQMHQSLGDPTCPGVEVTSFGAGSHTTQPTFDLSLSIYRSSILTTSKIQMVRSSFTYLQTAGKHLSLYLWVRRFSNNWRTFRKIQIYLWIDDEF